MIPDPTSALAGPGRPRPTTLSTPPPPKIFLSPVFSIASRSTSLADYLPRIATLEWSAITRCMHRPSCRHPCSRDRLQNLYFEDSGFQVPQNSGTRPEPYTATRRQQANCPNTTGGERGGLVRTMKLSTKSIEPPSSQQKAGNQSRKSNGTFSFPRSLGPYLLPIPYWLLPAYLAHPSPSVPLPVVIARVTFHVTRSISATWLLPVHDT
jgi:hypothetical protein